MKIHSEIFWWSWVIKEMRGKRCQFICFSPHEVKPAFWLLELILIFYIIVGQQSSYYRWFCSLICLRPNDNNELIYNVSVAQKATKKMLPLKWLLPKFISGWYFTKLLFRNSRLKFWFWFTHFFWNFIADNFYFKEESPDKNNGQFDWKVSLQLPLHNHLRVW